VSENDTAIALGSGDVPVLGTPAVLALLEQAACAAIASSLDPGDTSVGTWAELEHLPDEVVKERIRARRGLGEWTADWFLARHLARPEAWPAGDLGLRKAVSAFYLGGRDVSIEEVREMGSRFAPFLNLTAHYLLTGLRMVGT